MRGKGAAGPADIHPTFLKILGSMAKASKKGAVQGIWNKATVLPLKKTGKPLTCQPHILCFQDNGENDAQPPVQSGRDKGWLCSEKAGFR